MTKNKENAKADYINNNILNSWTYARLTEEEKKRALEAVDAATLCGNYKQRFEQIHNIYYSFLLALNYSPIGWRENKPGSEEELEEVKKQIADRLDTLGYNGAEYVKNIIKISGYFNGKPSRVTLKTSGGEAEIYI